ncbi:thiamine-monophosphate kinase [Candidatus Symbiothrix dinenymphae]|nr:thiamine-monophosphate kinase [Candidatus Symbiothrix dinenymphae]
MTEIASYGKFGLLDHLTKDIKTSNSTTLKGVGDDAAVLEYGKKATLVASALLLEGIHFDLTYFALKFVGYKAAVAAFADIYAMNGQPQQLTVSIGISKRFAVEHIDEIFLGLQFACKNYKVDIVKVDVTASLTGLCVATNCIGSADKETVVYQNTAKEPDLICVSGDLGGAYMGLQLLEREKAVHQGETDFTPDFAGKEYLLERQLRPEARQDIVALLAEHGIVPTAMVNVKDGLSSDMLHICQQSGVGCAIYEERIPIDFQTATMAETFNMNLTTTALNGGDDYELLFTVPLSMHEKIEDLATEGIHLIGHIRTVAEGAALITRDASEISLVAQGWTQEED